MNSVLSTLRALLLAARDDCCLLFGLAQDAGRDQYCKVQVALGSFKQWPSEMGIHDGDSPGPHT